MLNSIRQLLMWKITKGLSVDAVEDILQGLQERFHAQSVEVEEFKT